MKFDDMNMMKENTDELMNEAKTIDLDPEMVIKDLVCGREAARLFAELSIYGQDSLLVSCFDSAAEARGITSAEYLDELKKLYKRLKKKDGR